MGLTVGYFYNVRGYLEQVTGPGNALYYQVAEQDARGRLLQDWLGDDSGDFQASCRVNHSRSLSFLSAIDVSFRVEPHRRGQRPIPDLA